MLGMFKKKKFVSLIAALCMFGASLPAARASAYGALSLTDSYKATYTASSGIFTCAASPTDFWQFFGSSTKTIRILKIYYENMNTSSASVYFDNIYLIRRSTANSGASVSDTVVPLDSNNPAATGSPGHYTANPTVGTTAGTIQAAMVASAGPVVAAVPIFPRCAFDADKFGQAIVLRGTAQGVCLNLAGVTQAGVSPTMLVTVVWTEE